MTRSSTVQLVCDDCRAQRQAKPDVSLDDLREQLATVGWLSDKAGDADLCPTCAHRRLAQSRAGL